MCPLSTGTNFGGFTVKVHYELLLLEDVDGAEIAQKQVVMYLDKM